MMRYNRLYILPFFVAIFSLGALAQDSSRKAFVKVSGEVTKPLTLYTADLEKMPRSTAVRVIILADELEGKPLPAGKGPFRLVVPGEKKPARSSFQVTEFIVRYAKD
jgi:DMSO/TMAO reductase YedYZ molybdopterin-dependent catalytic subunit